MELGSTGRNKIPLPLQDEDGFFHRNSPVNRRKFGLSVEFGVVRLVLFQDVVDGSQQHSCNSDNSFLVTPALFNGKIPIADFRVALDANRTERTIVGTVGVNHLSGVLLT